MDNPDPQNSKGWWKTRKTPLGLPPLIIFLFDALGLIGVMVTFIYYPFKSFGVIGVVGSLGVIYLFGRFVFGSWVAAGQEEDYSNTEWGNIFRLLVAIAIACFLGSLWPKEENYSHQVKLAELGAEEKREQAAKTNEIEKQVTPFLPHMVDSESNIDPAAKYLAFDDEGLLQQFIFFRRVIEQPEGSSIYPITEKKHLFVSYSLSDFGGALLKKREGEWSINEEGLITAEVPLFLGKGFLKEELFFRKADNGRFYLSKVKSELDPTKGWARLISEAETSVVMPSGKYVLAWPNGSVETFFFVETQTCPVFGEYTKEGIIGNWIERRRESPLTLRLVH